MKQFFFLPFLALLFGCQDGYLRLDENFSYAERISLVNQVPELDLLKSILEGYPEIKTVGLKRDTTGNGTIDILRYTDGKNIHGVLSFEKASRYDGHERGKVRLYNTGAFGRRQEALDATWPIMLRIEETLINDFGMEEIRGNVKIELNRLKEPTSAARDRTNK